MVKTLWAGLDVGVDTTSVCVIDDSGRPVHESTCSSAVKSVHRELVCLRRRKSARVGIEAATGMTLARGLRNLGYQVDLFEQRQLSKFLRLRRNKTDAGDAIGIAEAGRLGAATVSRVYLKSLECQSLQSRLTIRRFLIRQRVAAVNLLANQLELYGGRLDRGDLYHLRRNVELEMCSIFGQTPTDLMRELRHLLDVCEGLIDYQRLIDRELKHAASTHELCRRFMKIPGVGPLCALTFYVTVGDASRFRRCADVGPYLGLVPTLKQSGGTLRRGKISKMGNTAARTLLYTASMTFLRSDSADPRLRAWASGVEQRSGKKSARIAVARKLATIMLAMWKTGCSYGASLSDTRPLHSQAAEADFAAT